MHQHHMISILTDWDIHPKGWKFKKDKTEQAKKASFTDNSVDNLEIYYSIPIFWMLLFLIMEHGKPKTVSIFLNLH